MLGRGFLGTLPALIFCCLEVCLGRLFQGSMSSKAMSHLARRMKSVARDCPLSAAATPPSPSWGATNATSP